MKEDGGPAFPRVAQMTNSGYVVSEGSGMSLHDWFAGQALVAMLPKIGVKDWDEKDQIIISSVGALAYEIADAMLKERAK